MTYRRRVTPLPSGPLRRPLSPAEDIAVGPIIAAARQAGAAGLVLVMRSGAEITLCFPEADQREAAKTPNEAKPSAATPAGFFDISSDR